MTADDVHGVRMSVCARAGVLCAWAWAPGVQGTEKQLRQQVDCQINASRGCRNPVSGESKTHRSRLS